MSRPSNAELARRRGVLRHSATVWRRQAYGWVPIPAEAEAWVERTHDGWQAYAQRPGEPGVWVSGPTPSAALAGALEYLYQGWLHELAWSLWGWLWVLGGAPADGWLDWLRWQCEGCGGWYGPDNGAADCRPGLCDDCDAAEHLRAEAARDEMREGQS